jgi:hypothetical protein
MGKGATSMVRGQQGTSDQLPKGLLQTVHADQLAGRANGALTGTWRKDGPEAKPKKFEPTLVTYELNVTLSFRLENNTLVDKMS